MKTDKNAFELTDDELINVTGGTETETNGAPAEGGFPIHFLDKCHFETTKFVSFDGNKERCNSCIYNPHKSWADSICDYPNRYYY